MSEESSPRFWERFPGAKFQAILPWIFLGYVLISIYPLVKFFLPEHYMKIGWRYYTIGDVKDENPAAYRKYVQENNQQMYRLFSQFASSEILKREAKERGVTVEELTRFAEGYEPAEAEIELAYNQFKNEEQLKGRPYKDVRADLINYLKAVQEDREKQALYQELRQKYETEIRGPELPPATKVAVETGDNPSIGPDNAKVTIVEFSDFECPYCAMSQTTTAALREQYKDKIKWVFRDFPMSFHRNAMFAHIAANCAIPQGKYWQLNNLLFKNGDKLRKENVISLAQQVGLNMGEFNRCISDEAAAKKSIQEDMAAGQKYGVNGTPAFFINGIMVEGNMPIQNFTKIIDEELKN
ncbi:DsbA family protein [Leptospira wolffii]|uniref:DsbA family protein n=1 Tax=Leptospira wolffii TaxID=409998 RepID=A0ABV5BQT4_9LEPT|nr:thioredoxin domain-containing protein [Leptospira wolffii]TGL53883.1 DsbA family protein [Leptospira wolffii]